MRRERVLYRDDEDKVFGGVCSGLGHYLDIDTRLVRVGVVVLTMVGGGGLLGYLLLWAVVDAAPAGYWDQATAQPAPEPGFDSAAPASGTEVIDLTDQEAAPADA